MELDYTNPHDLSNVFNIDITLLDITIDNIVPHNNIPIPHVFGDPKFLCECIKQYNRIFPVKQQINLYVGQFSKLPNHFEKVFGNSHEAFLTTRIIRYKDFIRGQIHPFIYTTGSRFEIVIDVVESNIISKFINNINVNFELGWVDGIHFTRFINFQHLYSIMLIKIYSYHYKFKQAFKNIQYINSTTVIKIVSENNFKILEYDVEPNVNYIEVNKSFGKFFGG